MLRSASIAAIIARMPSFIGPRIAAMPASSSRFFSASGTSSFSTLARKSARIAESLPLSSNGVPVSTLRASAITGSNENEVGTIPRRADSLMPSMNCE